MNGLLLRKTYLISMLIFIINIGYSQDVHFSHLHATPTILNPAMTGLFDGNLRFVGNYRGQWNGFTNGYKTIAAAADMKMKELKSGSIIGGGLNMFADEAGDLDFHTSSVGLNISFLQMIGSNGKSWVGVGFHNAFTQNRLDYSKIETFEQEPVIFGGNGGFWHIGAGVAWTYQFGKNNLLHLGGAMSHINTPDVSFFSSESGYDVENLDKKFTLHGGADIKLSRYFGVRPNFIFMDQGPHKEITIGTLIKYRKNNGLSKSHIPTTVYIGGWMRWFAEVDLAGTDAFIVAMRIDHKDTSFTLSYDLNTSSLTQASYAQGGTELSVMKILRWKKKAKNYKLKCPQDYF